jgi:hypothetical protein
MWKITKFMRNKHRFIPALHQDNKILIGYIDKANALGESFAASHSISKNLPSCNRTENEVKKSIDICKSKTIPLNSIEYCSANEIANLIKKKLKISKSPGFDNFNNRHLKILPRKSLIFLSIIFNRCFELGYFPLAWKHAKVVPIPKPQKDKKCTKNYRLVSLLSVIGKVFSSFPFNFTTNLSHC